MNNRHQYSLLFPIIFLSLFQSVCYAKRWTVNKIVARVNGVNILYSDLSQPRVDKDGEKLSLQEAIIEQLFFQRAKEKHMIPSDTDVEHQIVSLKMTNGISHLTDDDFEKQLQEELGISLEQYKGQLAKVLAVENVKQAEVSEKTFVSSQEVEAYYKKHPEYTKEQYHLKLCRIAKENISSYKKLIKKQKVLWKDLGWVNKEDIDKQFLSVLSMNPKQTTRPIQSGNKFIVLMLVDKKAARRKTLQESYGKIERILQKSKQKYILNNLEKELKQKSFITFL